jgi:rare lipoprotein A
VPMTIIGTLIVKRSKMNMKYFTILLFLVISPLMVSAGDDTSSAKEELKIQEGTASYYGKKFHLRKTANGEIFNMMEMTAAHKNLPFGTMLKVTNLKNGKEVWVRINDRLPQTSRRIIDLSKGAAEELNMVQDGIVKVKLEVPDQETVAALIAHYQDNKPESMRLRIYEFPIEVELEKPNFTALPLEINIERGLVDLN